MRVAICDDEKIFLEQMESLLNQIEGISCVDKYDDIDDLQENLEEETYEMIFMDIAWRGKEDTGVQFAESIFFEKVNLYGYLIKPIKMEKLSNGAVLPISKNRAV